MAPRPLGLGLIGDNIGKSRSPELHRLCGELTDTPVSYDLIVPTDQSFEEVLKRCARSGMRGVNVTYPYKERAAGMVACDAIAARVGSVNTIVFEPSGPAGHNTDYSGFIGAYRGAFGAMSPGAVAIVGAGGVGRAIAFALVDLGAAHLVLFDRERRKAAALADALIAAGADARAPESLADALSGADGVINGTPVGMAGHAGTPVPASLLEGRRWAFDAVYTPVETSFKRDAEAAGLKFLSGYALFVHQGVDAFAAFTGRWPPDLGAVYRRLLVEVAA